MKITVKDRAAFSAEKMAKVALAATSRALLDLYCLEPGQEQKPHAHDGQDKIYFVLDGQARVTLDGREDTLEPGEAVVAASGVSHGIRNATDRRLLVLVVVTPPPPHA
ncbi:MAG: cupin domain-containing protein [Candidatus Rokubacteria bacterium]|nr:cupin domain-containing protein [Candidatus Rokubacteria bacterium]MBI3826580.1 cupin domain-containing protein [Candidatus Rokubacteria bacterium]